MAASSSIWTLVSAVYETIVGIWWRSFSVNKRSLVHGSIIMICDRQSTKIVIIIHCRGTLNNDRTEDSITILIGEVAVIPTCSVLSSTEKVHSALTRSNWTFGDSIDTIFSGCMPLTETMPMHTRSVVLHAILDSNLHHITPLSNKSRARVCAIYHQHLLWHAIR